VPKTPPVRSARHVALVAALLGSLLPSLAANAQPPAGALALRASANKVTITKYRGEPIYLDLGIYAAAVGGSFEIRVTRPDYSEPIQAAQILYGANGKTTTRALPAGVIDGWEGFKDFFHIEISKKGDEIESSMLDFCPNGYDRQRIDDTGPDTVTYPDSCSTNPFTKGSVWGIDQGWAANTSAVDNSDIFLPVGTYDVTYSVDDVYVDLFDIPASAASVELEMKVEKQSYYGGKGRRDRSASRSMRPEASVPTNTSPSDAVLPDLIPLPAWSISAHNGRKRETIDFSANVWAAGAQSMVVEGFRRPNQELMDAYQYFYKDGQPVGRAPVGSLEFDDRTGHQHWHFLQFARYSLLDESQQEVVRSKKEAFCLAPTDAIDLTLENSVWTPYSTGLDTACGGPTALWVREVLPLGWGDTYFQSLPGQSFNITDLPNGTYYIEVTANPLGNLYEQTRDNNTELREITIKGKAGKRKVEVPPWNGIDSETPADGGDGEGVVAAPHH
jgi:hypothetical protein